MENQTPEEEKCPQTADRTEVNDSIAQFYTGIFDRVTGLWSNDPRYNEPGGYAGDIRDLLPKKQTDG